MEFNIKRLLTMVVSDQQKSDGYRSRISFAYEVISRKIFKFVIAGGSQTNFQDAMNKFTSEEIKDLCLNKEDKTKTTKIKKSTTAMDLDDMLRIIQDCFKQDAKKCPKYKFL